MAVLYCGNMYLLFIPEWYIVRRDETTLLTSLGRVTYHKTLFKNKFTGEHEYLLDRIS